MGRRRETPIEKIFEWMEKYPKLKIGLDYESFTFDEFSRCDPEIVDMISELLKKYPDRVGLGATTYGQPLSLTISEESNARQLTYAVKTNKEFFEPLPTFMPFRNSRSTTRLPSSSKTADTMRRFSAHTLWATAIPAPSIQPGADG